MFLSIVNSLTTGFRSSPGSGKKEEKESQKLNIRLGKKKCTPFSRVEMLTAGEVQEPGELKALGT